MVIQQTSKWSLRSSVSQSLTIHLFVPYTHSAKHNSAGATGTSFTWTPPQVTTSGLYALSITQSGAVNYSPQFTINSASQTTTSLTTVTSATSTSTNIIFSTAITPSAIVASSLIPSNATALPSVTNVPPYPTVNQNSTFTGPTGTVISASVYAYPSTTGAGNFSGAGLPSRFTGTAVRARSQVGIAAAVLLGALTWAVVMG